MAKARAGRRDQRIAKRAVAKASRTTKYANQKGGITKKAWRHGGAPEADPEDDAPMAVIRDGKAVWAGGADSTDKDAAPVEEPAEIDAADQRFSSAEKKLRALKKKLRRVQEIKDRRRRGEELDGAQQALLRTLPQLTAEVARFEAEVTGAAAVAADEEPSDDELGDDAADGDEQSDADEIEQPGSRLQQRREKKRKRHLERVRKRMERKEASR